jgi:ABC-type multidrug transport system ATPase subunit
MTYPLFAADSYSKSFGSNVVLKQASCFAARGRVTALLGRNGAGKSTLLKCAIGLMRADNGVTRWAGASTLRPVLHRLATEGLFFLPSHDLLARTWTVRLHFEALTGTFAEAVTPDADDPLDIGDLFEKDWSQLSGGERRRVELTLALARRPRCLLADEPFLGVAPKHQALFSEQARRLAREGAAVLITGHEFDRILSVADDVIWVVAGGTYVLGSPDQARAHPEFAAQYLGPRRASGVSAEAPS